MSKKMLSLLALVLTAVVILACGEAATTATTVTGTMTSAPQARHFKVGDQVKVGSWVVTINSAKTSAGDDLDQPKRGARPVGRLSMMSPRASTPFPSPSRLTSTAY